MLYLSKRIHAILPKIKTCALKVNLFIFPIMYFDIGIDVLISMSKDTLLYFTTL